MSAPAEPRAWSGQRWGVTIALVLGVQLGLLLWLSDRRPPRRIPVNAAPTLGFAGRPPDNLPAPGDPTWIDLANPTLFVLPHSRGFAGSLWRWTNSAPLQTFAWSAPLEWLALPPGSWDATPGNSNTPALSLSAWLEPVPEFTLPAVPPLPVLRDHSTWHIEGELARRRLLTPLTPQPWAADSVLATNTVVQLLVDAEGRTVSATLLESCKFEPADAQALEQARAARFDSIASSGPGRVTNPLSQLTWGQIVIEWATVPGTDTEAEEP